MTQPSAEMHFYFCNPAKLSVEAKKENARPHRGTGSVSQGAGRLCPCFELYLYPQSLSTRFCNSRLHILQRLVPLPGFSIKMGLFLPPPFVHLGETPPSFRKFVDKSPALGIEYVIEQQRR